jgi:predicted MPP superfamily phosphohydrolase
VKRPRAKFSRRKFLAGSVGLAASTWAYAHWIEPHWLRTRTVDVPLRGKGERQTPGPGGRAPLRVLHLSDFHASEEVSLAFIARAVAEGLALRPDLICLTGDFITWRYADFDGYARALKPLAAAAPTYAVLGNHDGGRWVGTAGYADTTRVRSMLNAAGVTLLHNATTEIRVQGRDVQLIGVGDLWAEELDGKRAFTAAPAAEPLSTPPPASTRDSTRLRLLLSHNPDSKEELGRFAWDVMLSGHTHGGQCDLVFFGTPFAPVRDHRFVHGLRRWEDRWIHVTAGVGNLHGVRLNCRPEVALLMIDDRGQEV